MSRFGEGLKQSIARARGRLIDPDALAQTLERLSAEGAISEARADSLRADLPGHVRTVRGDTYSPIRRIARWLVPSPAEDHAAQRVAAAEPPFGGPRGERRG